MSHTWVAPSPPLASGSGANRVARATFIGHAVQSAFWAPDLGGYRLEAGIDQVYASYGAWTSLGFLALSEVNSDAEWLDLARANVAALDARLHESDGGYAYRAYRCVDRVAKGCETGTAPTVVDHTRDTAAQAWAQHLHTALGRQLSASETAPSER